MTERYESCNWYDFPRYYDIVFDPDTKWEADFVERAWAEHGRVGRMRSVLEPACGTGRLVIEMARRGYAATGYDANGHMVAYAQRRLSRFTSLPAAGQVVGGRMESFSMPRGKKVDLVFSLLSTFKYLLSENDAVAHLEKTRDALRPGGLFLLGLHLTDYPRTIPEHERWVGERGGVTVTCNTRTWPADRRRRVERIRTRLTVARDGKIERRLESSWDARTYDAGQLRRLVAKVPGLVLTAGYDFGTEIPEEAPLGDDLSYAVLVLRKERSLPGGSSLTPSVSSA